mgnify:CR=1 FL=1
MSSDGAQGPGLDGGAPGRRRRGAWPRQGEGSTGAAGGPLRGRSDGGPAIVVWRAPGALVDSPAVSEDREQRAPRRAPVYPWLRRDAFKTSVSWGISLAVHAFVVLVLVLMLRPTGLLGESLGRARA